MHVLSLPVGYSELFLVLLAQQNTNCRGVDGETLENAFASRLVHEAPFFQGWS